MENRGFPVRRLLLLPIVLFCSLALAERPSIEESKEMLKTLAAQGYVISVESLKNGDGEVVRNQASARMEEFSKQIAKNPLANALSLESALNWADSVKERVLNGKKPEELTGEDASLVAGLLLIPQIRKHEAKLLDRLTALDKAQKKKFSNLINEMKIASTIFSDLKLKVEITVVDNKTMEVVVRYPTQLAGLARLQRDNYVKAYKEIKSEGWEVLFQEPALVEEIVTNLEKL